MSKHLEAYSSPGAPGDLKHWCPAIKGHTSHPLGLAATFLGKWGHFPSLSDLSERSSPAYQEQRVGSHPSSHHSSAMLLLACPLQLDRVGANTVSWDFPEDQLRYCIPVAAPWGQQESLWDLLTLSIAFIRIYKVIWGTGPSGSGDWIWDVSFPSPGHLPAAGFACSVCDMSDGLGRTQGSALHAHIPINAMQLARFGSPLGNRRRAAGD